MTNVREFLTLIKASSFGSQWLKVVPCKNLGLKLDDQQLRISIGLRQGANICVAHTCHCGKRVERDGLQGLSCIKSAGRFSRHTTLNCLIKQTLGSLDLPSVLEPRGLYRSDGKHLDGVTMISWEMGEQLVWDVTVVDALAPSLLNQRSLYNPGTTATEAEARNIGKYHELIENGYIFQPVDLEGPRTFCHQPFGRQYGVDHMGDRSVDQMGLSN